MEIMYLESDLLLKGLQVVIKFLVVAMMYRMRYL